MSQAQPQQPPPQPSQTMANAMLLPAAASSSSSSLEPLNSPTFGNVQQQSTGSQPQQQLSQHQQGDYCEIPRDGPAGLLHSRRSSAMSLPAHSEQQFTMLNIDSPIMLGGGRHNTISHHGSFTGHPGGFGPTKPGVQLGLDGQQKAQAVGKEAESNQSGEDKPIFACEACGKHLCSTRSLKRHKNTCKRVKQQPGDAPVPASKSEQSTSKETSSKTCKSSGGKPSAKGNKPAFLKLTDAQPLQQQQFTTVTTAHNTLTPMQSPGCYEIDRTKSTVSLTSSSSFTQQPSMTAQLLTPKSAGIEEKPRFSSASSFEQPQQQFMGNFCQPLQHPQAVHQQQQQPVMQQLQPFNYRKPMGDGGVKQEPQQQGGSEPNKVSDVVDSVVAKLRQQNTTNTGPYRPIPMTHQNQTAAEQPQQFVPFTQQQQHFQPPPEWATATIRQQQHVQYVQQQQVQKVQQQKQVEEQQKQRFVQPQQVQAVQSAGCVAGTARTPGGMPLPQQQQQQLQAKDGFVHQQQQIQAVQAGGCVVGTARTPGGPLHAKEVQMLPPPSARTFPPMQQQEPPKSAPLPTTTAAVAPMQQFWPVMGARIMQPMAMQQQQTMGSPPMASSSAQMGPTNPMQFVMHDSSKYICSPPPYPGTTTMAVSSAAGMKKQFSLDSSKKSEPTEPMMPFSGGIMASGSTATTATAATTDSSQSGANKNVYRYLCPECSKPYSCRKNVKRHRISQHKVDSQEAQEGYIQRVRMTEAELLEQQQQKEASAKTVTANLEKAQDATASNKKEPSAKPATNVPVSKSSDFQPQPPQNFVPYRGEPAGPPHSAPLLNHAQHQQQQKFFAYHHGQQQQYPEQYGGYGQPMDSQQIYGGTPEQQQQRFAQQQQMQYQQQQMQMLQQRAAQYGQQVGYHQTQHAHQQYQQMPAESGNPAHYGQQPPQFHNGQYWQQYGNAASGSGSYHAQQHQELQQQQSTSYTETLDCWEQIRSGMDATAATSDEDALEMARIVEDLKRTEEVAEQKHQARMIQQQNKQQSSELFSFAAVMDTDDSGESGSLAASGQQQRKAVELAEADTTFSPPSQPDDTTSSRLSHSNGSVQQQQQHFTQKLPIGQMMQESPTYSMLSAPPQSANKVFHFDNVQVQQHQHPMAVKKTSAPPYTGFASATATAVGVEYAGNVVHQQQQQKMTAGWVQGTDFIAYAQQHHQHQPVPMNAAPNDGQTPKAPSHHKKQQSSSSSAGSNGKTPAPANTGTFMCPACSKGYSTDYSLKRHRMVCPVLTGKDGTGGTTRKRKNAKAGSSDGHGGKGKRLDEHQIDPDSTMNESPPENGRRSSNASSIGQQNPAKIGSAGLSAERPASGSQEHQQPAIIHLN